MDFLQYLRTISSIVALNFVPAEYFVKSCSNRFAKCENGPTLIKLEDRHQTFRVLSVCFIHLLMWCAD